MSDTSANSISALTGAFLGLAVVVVALRFYARGQARVTFLVDDWLMLAALVAFIGTAACVFLLVHIKAIGYSSFEFTAAQKVARYDKSTKIQTSLVCLTTAVFACTKASALFFYRRIFCVPGSSTHLRIFNWVVSATIVVVACWFVAFELLTIFQCKGRFEGLWDPKMYARYCTITWDFLFGFSISDVILDVVVLALPIPNILYLHTSLARKLSVLAIFMLACVALGASIARLVVYAQVYNLGVNTFNHNDSEHTLTRVIFYYILECGCSIIAINLPSIWPVISSGKGLESVVKMARSVTSLASGRSNSSGSIDRSNNSRSQDVSTRPREDKNGEFVALQDLSASNGTSSSRQETI